MEEQKAEVKEDITKVSEMSLEEAKKKIEELEVELGKKKDKQKELQEAKQKEQLKKQQTYFRELERGAAFIKFVIEDLSRTNQYNRAFRRRIIKEMMNRRFSKEFVFTYENKLKEILHYIEENMRFLVAHEDIKAGEKVYIDKDKIFKAQEKVDAVELMENLKENEKV